MGHTFIFDRIENVEALISQQEIEDIISLFYRWNDTTFKIVCYDKEPGRRGSHIYLFDEKVHRISLSAPEIIRGVRSRKRMGGTGPAPDPRTGIGMVLVHEIQHANQAGQHLSTEKFYTHRDYESRPCEKEARQFVDTHIKEIVSILQPQMMESCPPGFSVAGPPVPKDGIADVLELLCELQEVSITDIRTELKLSGLNNPLNFGKVVHELASRGIRVV